MYHNHSFISRILFLTLSLYTCLNTAAEENPEPPLDGYAALLQVAKKVKTVVEAKDRDFRDTLRETRASGSPLSDEQQALLSELTPELARLTDIANTPVWNSLPRSEINASTEFEGTTGVFILADLVGLQVIHLLHEKEDHKAAAQLNAMSRITQRFATSGVLIDGLVSIACDQLLSSHQVTLLSRQSETELKQSLLDLKQHYATFPSPEEIYAGEFAMFENTVDLVFEERALIIPQETKAKLLTQLAEQGVPQQTLDKIKHDKILSPLQWKEQMQRDTRGLLRIQKNSLHLSTPKELEAYENEITAFLDRVHPKGDRKKYEQLEQKFLNLIGQQDPIDLPVLFALHDQIGRILSRQYLDMIQTDMSGVVKHYLLWRANEKLKMIHAASRLYELQTGEAPHTLQDLVESSLLEPDPIVDPLSGREFRLRPGLPLHPYCVGTNQKDDGAVENDRKKDLWLEPLPQFEPAPQE